MVAQLVRAPNTKQIASHPRVVEMQLGSLNIEQLPYVSLDVGPTWRLCQPSIAPPTCATRSAASRSKRSGQAGAAHPHRLASTTEARACVAPHPNVIANCPEMRVATRGSAPSGRAMPPPWPASHPLHVAPHQPRFARLPLPAALRFAGRGVGADALGGVVWGGGRVRPLTSRALRGYLSPLRFASRGEVLARTRWGRRAVLS